MSQEVEISRELAIHPYSNVEKLVARYETTPDLSIEGTREQVINQTTKAMECEMI